MSLTQKNIQTLYSGDKVIQFMPSKKLKAMQGVFDLQTTAEWYDEDEVTNHLGLLNFFGQQSIQSYGILPDLLKNRNILETGRDGKFTYDVPVYEEDECMTIEDMSHQVKPGIDGTTFKIVLSENFKPGDVLTSDKLYGQDIVVTEEEVIMIGTGFEHIVKLVSNDIGEWYSESQLAAGISYYKINHGIFGEYGTNYSAVELSAGGGGSFRCEFELGSERGVELFLTGKADKNFSGAALNSDLMGKIEDKVNHLGDVALLMDYDKKTKKVKNLKSAKLASTVQLLVDAELDKLTATALMFQKAGKIDASHGSARFNEGLWHQIRRGKLIKYARPQGMNRTHISEAVEYLFRGNPLAPEMREIMFEAGSRMYENFMEVFRDEINQQLSNLSGIPGLLGTDAQIPKSPITGSSLTELELGAVRFTKVFLPGIGSISVKRNYALDYMASDADRMAKGMHPNNTSHTTYSAIIWDANSQEYSNNKKMPDGAKLINGGNPTANVYLVKPEGALKYSGFEGGRYSPYKSSDIMSSVRTRSVTYWAYNSCAVFIPDPSRFVSIELDPAARKGYL